MLMNYQPGIRNVRRIKNWKITIKPFGLTAAFYENYFSQTDERFQDVEIPF